MILSRSFELQILRAVLAIALVTSATPGAATAWALGQPPGPAPKLAEAETARMLLERENYKRAAYRAQSNDDRDGANAAIEKKLAIERRLRGDRRGDIVQSLSMLADIQAGRGDLPAARESLKELISIGAVHSDLTDWRVADARRKMIDLDRLDFMTPQDRRRMDKARSLDLEASALNKRGNYPEMLPVLMEELKIRRELQGQNHPDVATTLGKISGVFQLAGEFRRAEIVLGESLKITAKTRGEQHPEFASSLCQLGLIHFERTEFERAELQLSRGVETLRKTLGEDHPQYAIFMGYLASVFMHKGDFAHAETLCLRAIAIEKKVLGEESRVYATTLDTLAGIYREMKDDARAEPVQRAVVETMRKAIGEGQPEYASSLCHLGVIYLDLRDYARAEPVMRKALEVFRKTLGEGHPAYINGLESLGLIYLEMNDLDRAGRLLREAADRFKKTLGEKSPAYAHSLSLLADMSMKSGDHARAEKPLGEALEIRKKSLGERHPDTIKNMISFAEFYINSSQISRSEPWIVQAMGLCRETWGQDHELYHECEFYLAAVRYAAGDAVRARSLLRASLDSSAAISRDTAAVLGERQRLLVLRKHGDALGIYLSVGLESAAVPAELYDRVFDFKSVIEGYRAGDFLVRDQPELRPAVERLSRVRSELANMAFDTPTGLPLATWRERFDTLRVQKETLESDLAGRSVSYRTRIQTLNRRPDDIATQLPADTALIDLLEYNHFSSPQGGKAPFQTEPRLLAFVVRRGRPIAVVQLGAARVIDESVRSWRRALGARRGGDLQSASAELGQRVWEPLRPHLADARTVLIAPDGSLSFFPFAALPGSRPGSFLIEDMAIGYVASGRSAIEALSAPQGPAGRGLLAVGDVDFQADPGQLGPAARPPSGITVAAKRAGFGPLPGTGPEARRARELFHAAFAGQAADLMTRAEPTEAAIKRRLDGGHWRVVHLGTHGFFESPARIAVLRAQVRREDPPALAPKDAGPGEDTNDFALTPLLRSGVVLAGGGRNPGDGLPDASFDAPPREDGILTAEEVQALDMPGTELVVLSACETGLGSLESGQGVMGLQRAFQAAGARAVVASLWKVNDAATTVLME